MKKIFGGIFLTIMLWVLSCQLFAATITADDLRGDDNFINKILSLQKEDNTIVDNSIYVATDGSDSNSGTVDSPYATVYYAISKAKAGQTIYIRGGIYSQNIVITKSGTEGNYITIRNYPNEKAIFDHTNYSTDGGAIIELSKVNYIHIQGLKLCNKNLKSSSGYGILMRQGNHIIIKDVEISNINVPDPKSSKVGANAIILYGNNASVPISNVIIDGCYVHDCQTGWSEAISVNGNSEYVNVINSKVENIGNIGLDFAGHFNACKDSSLDQARYCVAVGNVVSKCVSPNATSYGLYNDGGRDNIFDRNIVYECSGGIEIGSEEGAKYSDYPVKNVVVKNNLVYNNTQAGLSVGGYDNDDTGIVYNTKIYNNTLVNNGNSDSGNELGINKTSGTDIRNNIFYKDNDLETVKIRFTEDLAGNLTFKNNCYYSTRTESNFKVVRYGETFRGFDNWKTASGETGIYKNPNFGEEYNLLKNSPCIDAGDSTADSGKYDILSNKRNINNIDIGCYEYNGSEVTTTTTVETSTETTTTSTTTTKVTETSTENTTVTTTTESESSSETTTENSSGSTLEWDFTDSNWSDKTATKTIYTVNGITVRHNGTASGIKGFKFDKNTKSNKLNYFYIRLYAKAKDKLTVYVNYNSSKADSNVVLTIAKVNDDNTFTTVDTQSVKAVKTGDYTITFNIVDDGNYIVYTDTTSVGTAFYNKVIIDRASVTGDINGDGILDKKDIATILKHCSGGKLITDSTILTKADVNNDGKVDLIDVGTLLNSIE